jgi:hypothetical protein
VVIDQLVRARAVTRCRVCQLKTVLTAASPLENPRYAPDTVSSRVPLTIQFQKCELERNFKALDELIGRVKLPYSGPLDEHLNPLTVDL